MSCRKIPLRPGCAFFWLLFFAQAKKSDSLVRAKAFDFALNCFYDYLSFCGSGDTLTPPPLPEGEGLKDLNPKIP